MSTSRGPRQKRQKLRWMAAVAIPESGTATSRTASSCSSLRISSPTCSVVRASRHWIRSAPPARRKSPWITSVVVVTLSALMTSWLRLIVNGSAPV